MLSRDAKRIASRSQIRIQAPIAKRFQQRCANPINTGIDTWSDTAEEIPDQISIELRHGLQMANSVERWMAIPDAERVMNREVTETQTRLDMGDETQMGGGVTTRLGYRVGMPMATQTPKRVHMPMMERMTDGATRRIWKQLEK